MCGPPGRVPGVESGDGRCPSVPCGFPVRVCWIGSQVQLLPVGQVIETGETVAYFVEGIPELCGVQAVSIKYLL